MDLGPHAGFIIAAYIIATAVVAALVIWVAVDHTVQKRALAELRRTRDSKATTVALQALTAAAASAPGEKNVMAHIL